MKVLVTGANGFVGKWLVRHLLDQGLDVSIFVRPKQEDNWSNVKVLYGDIVDLQSVMAACAGMDSVFHLAGYIGYSPFERLQMEKVNVFGTANVIQACRSCDVRRLLHFSSVVAVGAGRNPKEILSEDSTYNLASYDLGYFETKRKAERLVRDCVLAGQLDAVIVNPSTIYGAGDAEKGSRQTQIKVAQGKMPFFTSGGASVVDVDSVVRATFQAWKAGRTGERYILSGHNVTIKELFETIARAAGVEAPRIRLPTSMALAIGTIGDWLSHANFKSPLNSESARVATLYHWFDNTKAKRELGLSPKSLETSIGESVTWMREKGLLPR